MNKKKSGGKPPFLTLEVFQVHQFISD